MERDAWLAELPPQIRRAYETQSWDEIPAKWRDLLREWTRRQAEERARDR